jgi:hypothetical protein
MLQVLWAKNILKPGDVFFMAAKKQTSGAALFYPDKGCTISELVFLRVLKIGYFG